MTRTRASISETVVRRLFSGGLVWMMSAGIAPCALAQVQVNEPPDAPIQFGPLFLTPDLTVREVGVDTNVFNDDREERDFTATIGSGLEAVVLFGPGRLTATTLTDYVWYQDFAEERSVNNRLGVGLEAFLTHLRPFVEAEYLRTRERPGFEIDARARRTDPRLTAGVDLVLGSRTTLALSASRFQTEFAPDETFEGVNLSQALNNTANTFRVAYRMALTPLTTFVLNTELQHDRFDAASFRNADSYRVAPRLEFDPDALVSGDVEFGFRHFKPRGGLQPYRGLVGRAAVSYTMLQSTQFTLDFQRDTGYSFEEQQPYYIQTGGTLSMTQRIAGPWDLLLRGGRQQLRYREPGVPDADARLDHVTTYGGGVGYRLGETVRIGVNVERARRRSTEKPDRRYDRDRYFLSVAYVL